MLQWPNPRMRPLLAAVVLAVGAPAAALAQAGPAAATPPATPTFISRSAFDVGFAHLTSDDPRFVWAARVNADVDVADYCRGRINFWGVYEGILGSERRLLDLNHENFIVEGSASHRIRASELSLVFHHVSWVRSSPSSWVHKSWVRGPGSGVPPSSGVDKSWVRGPGSGVPPSSWVRLSGSRASGSGFGPEDLRTTAEPRTSDLGT